jgi:hypothetical protein
MSPNGLRTLLISPDFPTAFLTALKPSPTAPLAPTIPATPPATLPSILKPPVTAFLPVATVLARCSILSNLGYTTGTGINQRQCCTLGGRTATLGNKPWYVGPAMTWCGLRSDLQSGPTTTTDGPRYLMKCHPVPVTVKISMSSETLRRMSRLVWCWKSRYISMPIRPMFLNILLNCMYSG